jgi:hypothetical protein
MLARQRLLRKHPGKRHVLVVSNPAGGLPLLEAFSRNTVLEFRNAGYRTTAIFGRAANRTRIRRALPKQDIFLWEGHHSILIKTYHVHEWTEPLRPALIFLQSCLALEDYKAQPFLHRGALAVVGSSTRTYSASGGALTLAFFDALHYDRQSLGGGLRHAKNFLLAYALLKQKRLGKEATRGGANLRTAWAFTLWGDPTVVLPPARRPKHALAPVEPQVRGNTIVIALPDTAYARVTKNPYQTEMRPNARLAGLLKEGDEGGRLLVPFVFAEVRLPRAPRGKQPVLKTRLPGRQWVFCWDGRRKCGYLLVTPRNQELRELRFHVRWQDED